MRASKIAVKRSSTGVIVEMYFDKKPKVEDKGDRYIVRVEFSPAEAEKVARKILFASRRVMPMANEIIKILAEHNNRISVIESHYIEISNEINEIKKKLSGIVEEIRQAIK